MMIEFTHCPGTLAKGHSTYSTSCLRSMFDGRRVSHILPYHSPQVNENDDRQFLENRTHISISGVQEKLSLVLEKNTLRLAAREERGNYLLKPIPRDLKHVDQVPANEHLTMQIARQVYGISTAENAMIFFRNGDPAYITRRFDVWKNRGKRAVEDFASLAMKTEENSGPDYKYNYSYEELAVLAQNTISAYPIEVEKLFRLFIFNFLFSNGDAHLKNFSIMATGQGDYVLSPAYDLVNTRIHIDDSDFALTKGLFRDNFQSGNAHDDFAELGVRMGVKAGRVEGLLHPFHELNTGVLSLVSQSFLNERTKRGYLQHYRTKRNNLAPT